jgi:hypothetical protein
VSHVLVFYISIKWGREDVDLRDYLNLLIPMKMLFSVPIFLVCRFVPAPDLRNFHVR